MVHLKDRDRAPLRKPAAESTLVLPANGTGAPLRVGHLLGGRYEIRGVLGRGGMGEVWLARDLKLQVEVALKTVAPEKLSDEGALARLRAEVRSSRAVASPHVCRVYDLVEAEGLECVSMEYVDGTTLRHVLETRSPLDLAEAREIALQLLAGLGAIHEAGLVHRDVKPENVMLTRAGRVVLMDFGIAKAVASGGTVSGTPAYWPPEQAMGAPADPRADVFAAGIVLAEMVAPSGVCAREQLQALWLAVREDPPRVPDTPWSEAIARAVSREPGARYPSAQALARALEEVAHRVTGIEEAQPYPGLAAFAEADAEYFFGREAEVEEVWKRLPHRHLLALVGPSGAGKSSFLRAGLVPAKPEGWVHLVCTPGDTPFVALGQALVTEVSHDTEAIRQMLRFEDADVAVHLFRRWRGAHAEALVIVDQLEELFTLNPPEVQARFASLLSRLALEADVHVLLSMRDDFLLRCQEHEALRPVFEGLVPLGPPAGDALRRALMQPALKCGYRFEDEALVAEMLQAVEGERGALPLLAFAAASLWRKRDREGGLLTHAAHDSIGGVAGALTQHAEATLDRVGADKLPLVREMFRNLVTAQGTRAVRDVDELLTVFPEGRRADAEAVLRALIDARLLTSYEAHATEPRQTAGRRVEVVHESLLTAWPRLVRWRTEDEGGAQLRDQLRQVAHLWEEKGKPADLLWTGTSYQEYQVWRARYPGGLSDTEEAFGRAMIDLAGRRRRQRRAVYAAILTAVVLTAAGLGFLLRKSVRETRRAEAETGQREAAQILALGRLKLADHPNASLAYAIASLERSDNGPARRFAVEALWQGPPALFIPDTPGLSVKWSPDGRWLALGGGWLELIEGGTGQRRRLIKSSAGPVAFTSDSRRLVSSFSAKFEVWALPEGRLERTLEHSPTTGTDLVDNDRLLTFWSDTSAPLAERPRLIRRLSLDGTPEQTLGRWEPHGTTGFSIDPSGIWIFSVQRGLLLQQRLDTLSAPPRVLSVHEGNADVWAKPWRDRLVTRNSRGEVHIWDVPSARIERTLKSPADSSFISLDPRGRFLATSPYEAMAPRSMFLFDLAAPPTAEPVGLLDNDATWLNDMNFSPDGSWLASEHSGTVVLWNTARACSLVVGRQKPPNMTVAFTRDGRLLSASDEGVLRSWPLDPAAGADMRVLWSRPGAVIGVARVLELDPGGRSVILTDATGWQTGKVLVVPLNGSAPSIHQLEHPEGRGAFGHGGMLDAGGRFLAMAIAEMGHSETNAIRILDLVTGDERTLDTHPKSGEGCEPTGSDYAGFAVPLWLRDGRLVSDGDAGLRVWDLVTGTSQRLRPCKKMLTNISLLASPDSRLVLRLDGAVQTGYDSSLSVFDLASRVTREITSHGKSVLSFALDPSGTILVTGDKSGIVRVGRLTGGEPHLLFGHNGPVTSVAVSPDGRRIASGSDDGTIRLWPMPEMTKPPLHTLPYDELLVKLKSLTNLRAVRDAASDTGWKIVIGLFPGWKDVPIW
jgi:WD40 repeat protein